MDDNEKWSHHELKLKRLESKINNTKECFRILPGAIMFVRLTWSSVTLSSSLLEQGLRDGRLRRTKHGFCTFERYFVRFSPRPMWLHRVHPSDHTVRSAPCVSCAPPIAKSLHFGERRPMRAIGVSLTVVHVGVRGNVSILQLGCLWPWSQRVYNLSKHDDKCLSCVD